MTHLIRFRFAGLVALFLVCLLNCQPPGAQPDAPGSDGATPVITYIIRAGRHEVPNNPQSYTTKQRLRFTATFDNSAIYTSRVPSNQYDVNKLYGLSDCTDHHQTNSARFGWSWRDGALRIFAYCYVNRQRVVEEIGTAELNRPQEYELRFDGGHYVFVFGGRETRIARACTQPVNMRRYRLYPYFGGDETAPHDIKILIQEKAE